MPATITRTEALNFAYDERTVASILHRTAERAAVRGNERGTVTNVRDLIECEVTSPKFLAAFADESDAVLGRSIFTAKATALNIAGDLGHRFNTESILMAAAALHDGKAKMWERQS